MIFNSTAWIFAAIVPSLFIAWGSAFVVRQAALRWGLIDLPAARKVHATPTPLGGGVAIWLGVVATFALGQLALWVVTIWPELLDRLPELVRTHANGIWSRSVDLWVLLGCATTLMLVGLIDDRRGLGWKLRMAIQVGVAAFCVYWQGISLTAFIGVRAVTMGLSVVWIVGLINSFNMLDNMDGLSSGVAAIAASMLAAVLLLSPATANGQPQLFVAGFLLVLVGALLGFLWHNRTPARMFMGDAGSYFVGFCVAVATLLATYTGYNSTTTHTILAPLCVMAVPLYDMTTVLWIRIREGRSPFQADKCHFSHRLVDLGMTKGQAVLTIYLTTATCGLGALLLSRVDFVGAVLIVLLIVCVLALIAILESSARRKIKQ